jgi:hypothetical protein
MCIDFPIKVVLQRGLSGESNFFGLQFTIEETKRLKDVGFRCSIKLFD